MHKTHNSSELAKRVSEKLKLNQEDSLELYKELSQLPDGHVKDALSALMTDKTSSSTHHEYAACIKGTCVRNAQYSKWEDAMPLDDDAWVNANEKPIFLGIIEADTPTRAKQIVAARVGVSENVIELYDMNRRI